MRPLTAHDIIWTWETGQRQDPLDRALTILAAACPEMSREQLAELSLGQRDRRLFQLREWLFGSELHVLTECPQCHERLEFPVERPAIRGNGQPEPRI